MRAPTLQREMSCITASGLSVLMYKPENHKEEFDYMRQKFRLGQW